MYTSNLWGWLQLQLGIAAGGKLNTVLYHRDKTGAGALGIMAPEGRAEYKKQKHTDGKQSGYPDRRFSTASSLEASAL